MLRRFRAWLLLAKQIQQKTRAPRLAGKRMRPQVGHLEVPLVTQPEKQHILQPWQIQAMPFS